MSGWAPEQFQAAAVGLQPPNAALSACVSYALQLRSLRPAILARIAAARRCSSCCRCCPHKAQLATVPGGQHLAQENQNQHVLDRTAALVNQVTTSHPTVPALPHNVAAPPCHQ